ncbi:beta-glycosidase [Flammeovirga sp. MY04]|uniref:glycoside hydrolase n=1 Tax=Flammeovirga sp. MY04 TaxID=1191459 RepID=UPI0008063518|nr:glycoside hydrolase [Flammeovirga sp. MY04]ANQ51656.1 beta-glycosidase [Flammeovirga sp. MY04]
MRYLLSVIVLFYINQHCWGSNPPTEKKAQVTINTENKFQKIEFFSASDCWAGNWVGTYWSKKEKEQIADLFFSKKIKKGQPQGIGLTGWRFNLGGGTTELGDSSDIKDVSRRSESFLEKDGSYNWNKEMGQQYFAQKAVKAGIDNFILFSITPEVTFTKNGKGYSPGGTNFNILPNGYKDYSIYMADVIEHFNKEGINFNLVSPVNEPQYNWDTKGQEGTPAHNDEIYRFVKNIDSVFVSRGIKSKILLGEAADWEYLYKEKTERERSLQIEDFFSDTSAISIKNFTTVKPTMSAHSYWFDRNFEEMKSTRSLALEAAQRNNIELCQTEWSMLSKEYDYFPGYKQASTMDIALVMSNVINHDLNYANVTSWSYWTAMDLIRWNHKNRFCLVEVIPEGGSEGDITKSGTHIAHKTLWALGNYSLFIRPDFERVEMDLSSDLPVVGTSFISSNQQELVVVYTNLSDENITFTSSIDDQEYQLKEKYVTDAENDLKASDIDNILPKRSVTTFIYKK